MLFFKNNRVLFPGRKILSLCMVLSLGGALTACDLAANYTKTDRAADMEVQSFRDGLAERTPDIEKKKEQSKAASIPELQPYVSMTPDSMQAMPLVSVSVNQSVPLRDILFELAEQADYDLELDPNIRGSIIFTARNKPFDQVIKRIARTAGLRYKFEDSVLRVEQDTPYIKTYKIDYLSFVRSNQGNVSTNVSVVSGEGGNSGSSFSASSDSVSDFWGELESSLTQVLGGASTGGLRTRNDPRISAVEQNPDVAAVSPDSQASGGDDSSVQPPEAVLRVDSLPVDDGNGSAGGNNTGPAGGQQDPSAPTFSLNKQAGLVNVYASEKMHKEVQDYLNEVRRAVTSQVLVEAKVFEVSLYDEFRTGIEWSALTENNKGVVRFVDAVSDNVVSNLLAAPGGEIASQYNFGIGYLGGDISGFMEAVSGFGTVRALASPRMTVLNNQAAVLNVATNRVFFELDVDRETDDDTGDVTLEVDSEIQSVPEGVLINVQPSIDLDSRQISMAVRPTITRVVGTVDDPSVQVATSGLDIELQSEIPEINVQEIDTVVKVNSGQPIVMGGLLQDRIESDKQSVPVLGEVPLFGSLFRAQDDSVSKTELVIFLKATLIENTDQTVHNTDKDLYRAFSGDRRPFDL